LQRRKIEKNVGGNLRKSRKIGRKWGEMGKYHRDRLSLFELIKGGGTRGYGNWCVQLKPQRGRAWFNAW